MASGTGSYHQSRVADKLVIEQIWEAVLGAITEEVSRLEEACVGGHSELLLAAEDPNCSLPFIPPEDIGTMPAHMVSQAISLQRRIAYVEGQIETALRAASQDLAVTHELARNAPGSHPQFIDTSL